MSGEKFWDFSVRTYKGEGVQAALLEFQNARGADINLLLFCLWYGKNFGVFDDVVYARAREFSGLWAGRVVVPLREVRTWMKHTGCPSTGVPVEDCMELRERVKDVELSAEKLQEDALEAMCGGLAKSDRDESGQLKDALANARRYFADIDIAWDDWSRERMTALLLSAFPGLSADRIDLSGTELKIREIPGGDAHE